MLTEISTKVTGRMEKLMAMESLLTLKDPCMKDNGKMINNTEWVQKPGIKDKLDILDNFKTAKKPVGEDLSSMEATMMVTSSMESSMEKVNTILPILVKFMKVILKITICTVAELWFGQINHVTMANLKKEKWKAMVSNNMPKVIDT